MTAPVEREALVRLATRLRDLHHGRQPLVLPNVWHVGSALAVERAGAKAIATTSSGVAETFGLPDGEAISASEMLLTVLRIAGAVRLPMTADVEAGYGLSAEDLVHELLRTGAAGMNLEDTHRSDDADDIVPVELQTERLAAVRRAADRAGVPIVVNARMDLFLRRPDEDPRELLVEAVERCRAYLDAGADCVYPIGLADAGVIGRLVRRVRAPVNILLRPGAPPLRQLRSLGVKRVSVGAGLWRLAEASTEALARRLLSGDDGPFRTEGAG